MVKRVHNIDNTKNILCGHEKRRVIFRCSLFGILNDVVCAKTEKFVKTLKLNQEKVILRLDKEVDYPVVLLIEILCVIPDCLNRMVTLNSTNIPESEETMETYSTDTESENSDEDFGQASDNEDAI